MKNQFESPKKCEYGFSMISLLISLAIVGVLMVVAITSYNKSGFFNQDMSDEHSVAQRINKTLTYESLEKFHFIELNYKNRYGHFATFEELLSDESIPAGYTAKLEAKGVPYIEYWDIHIDAKQDTYLLLAVPNANASGLTNVPILGMNETGKIWEEQELDETELQMIDSGEVEAEEEDVPPFFPETPGDSEDQEDSGQDQGTE
jgi:Tfp pilus assembly protein PilE